MANTEVQKQWALNPKSVALEYGLTETQANAMIAGDIESLITEGLAERHIQEMRVSW